MTHNDLTEWGAKEAAQRIADLQDRTDTDLKRAKANAEARRKAAGLSKSEAMRAVAQAIRRNRQERSKAS